MVSFWNSYDGRLRLVIAFLAVVDKVCFSLHMDASAIIAVVFFAIVAGIQVKEDSATAKGF